MCAAGDCCIAFMQVHMADNNGRVVYSVPHRSWGRNYGVRVFRTDVLADGSVPTAYKVTHLVAESQGVAAVLQSSTASVSDCMCVHATHHL